MIRKKILIVRFSSIGDIVLTTPVIRCIKQQIKDVELHYLTKRNFAPLLQANPFIDKIFSIEKNISEVKQQLNDENYDHIIDLHHNLRTFFLKSGLKRPSTSFNKLNIEKWLYVNLKINKLNNSHVVDRYLKAATPLGIKYDGKGLDYFIPEKDQINISDYFNITEPYIAFVIGAKFFTKALPVEKIIAICRQIHLPVILIGGKEDATKAESILKEAGNCYNACGKLSLNQSASVIQQSYKVIAHDTGFMHIATALGKPVVSIWGNTTPELGFAPFFADDKKHFSDIIEVKGLRCRPCSKLGYDKCPKGHFKCMKDIDVSAILNALDKVAAS